MCELFGLCANKPVTINFTWKGFYRRGEFQPHGWGIAYYKHSKAEIIKEPIASVDSETAKSLRDEEIFSNIFISHIRYATSGVKTVENTHPFKRTINGVDWVFAHNGTLSNFRNLKLIDFQPEGRTDSEYAFCYIADRLKSSKEGESIAEQIKEVVDEITENEGREIPHFNFLLSNGKQLFTFWSGYKSLYYLERKMPMNAEVKLNDEDLSVNLKDIKSVDERAVLIATNPLTDENWERFEEKKLYVFEEGSLMKVVV